MTIGYRAIEALSKVRKEYFELYQHAEKLKGINVGLDKALEKAKE